MLSHWPFLACRVRPYMELMRLEKPIGSWLLYWPGAWSLALATHPSPPSIRLLALFGLGAIVMRGAGCTINDLWDRNLDKLVERTRDRPLASHRLERTQAISWLGIQLSAGLAILLQLNGPSVLLGAASLLPVIVYPLMKRITYWPQLVLGLTFNWGALLGWTAADPAGLANWSVMLPLYAGGICWTLVYDTIYALQDIKDDLTVGIKSTAILFGAHVKTWLTGFATASLGFFALAGYQNGMSWPYYMGVAGCALHYTWQLCTLRPAEVTDCLNKFKSNRYLGAILFMGIVADGYWEQIVAGISHALTPTIL